MNRKGLVASFGLVAGLTAVTPAQAPAPPSNGQVDQKAVQSVRVKVIGCVAGDTETGRYVLTGAFLTGDDTLPTVGTSGKIGSGKDLSFENSLCTTSSEAASRHILAMKSKSSASAATRN